MSRILTQTDYRNPIHRVAQLWRMGSDTYDISQKMGLSEPEVCRLLWRWRDARRSS